MKLAIVTGCSKGLGNALVRTLLKNKYQVIGLARQASQMMHVLDPVDKNFFIPIDVDLSSAVEIDQIFSPVLERLDKSKITEAILFQGAATVSPIGVIGGIDSSEISKSIQLNLAAPAILANCFIRHLQSVPAKKQIFFISSGAATNPIGGATLYCATKAAMEMLSKAIHHEQKDRLHPVRSIAIRPGVFESQMQSTLRSADRESFPDVDKFLDMKEKNILKSAEQIANVIFNELVEKSVISGDVYDVWKLLPRL